MALSFSQAKADNVYVGYADAIRPSPFFPVPWAGAPGVIFNGVTGAPNDDAGAIRVDNLSGATESIDISVTFPDQGVLTPIDLWGATVVPAGDTLIVTETAFNNFDTSDFSPLTPVGVPLASGLFGAAHVTIDTDGNPVTLYDTGHVLNTGGFDLGDFNNSNESLNWRLIGTSGIENPSGAVPDVTGVGTLAIAALGLAGFGRVSRRIA